MMRIDKDSDFKHKGGSPDSTEKATASSKPTSQDISRATPRPWHVKVTKEDHGGWKQPTQRVEIWYADTLIAYYNTDFCEHPGDEENEANAELIVAAVNQHDGFVEVGKQILKSVGSHIDLGQGLTMRQIFPGEFAALEELLSSCGSLTDTKQDEKI